MPDILGERHHVTHFPKKVQLCVREPAPQELETQRLRHFSSLAGPLGRSPVQCSGVSCFRGRFSKAAALPAPREQVKVDNSGQSGHRPCLICSEVMKQYPGGSQICPSLPLPEQASLMPNFYLTGRGQYNTGLLTTQSSRSRGLLRHRHDSEETWLPSQNPKSSRQLIAQFFMCHT